MPKGIHKEDIKAMVRKQGHTMKDLSIQYEFNPSALTASLYKPYPKANHIIAYALGLTVHEIWPEWYDATGKRIYQPRKQSIAKKQSRHCQKSKGELA